MIIFDKDGTLGNDKRSLKLWKEKMTNRILNHLLFKQIDTSDIMSEYHEAIGWDVRKNDLKPSAPLAAGTWKETIDILVKVFDNYFSEAETLIPLWQREIENKINHADDPPDTGVAKNSGVGLMLAVLSGTGTAKELAENGADHLLSDVSKVPEMLMQLKQSCTGCKEIDINDESNFGEISILESCTSEAIYIQA
eukprot:Awhi_evm1s13129